LNGYSNPNPHAGGRARLDCLSNSFDFRGGSNNPGEEYQPGIFIDLTNNIVYHSSMFGFVLIPSLLEITLGSNPRFVMDLVFSLDLSGGLGNISTIQREFDVEFTDIQLA